MTPPHRPRRLFWLLLLAAGILVAHLWLVLARPWQLHVAAPPTAVRAVATRSTALEPAPASSPVAAAPPAEPATASAAAPALAASTPPRPGPDRAKVAASAPAMHPSRPAMRAPGAQAASAAASTAAAALASTGGAAGPGPAVDTSAATPQPTGTNCPTIHPDQWPQPVRARYRLSRGPLAGDGLIEWRVQAQAYAMRLEGRVPLLGTLLEQRSEGSFDACGLAPVRHTERRLKRSERALSFRRQGSGGEVLFSTQADTAPLEAGMQDRLSWMVQLAGLLNARQASRAPVAPGMTLGIAVAAVGGDIQHWHFTVVDRAGDGTWHLRREADSPYDTHADVWCDPARRHWPVRVELREARGDPLRLQLSEFSPLR